jgi:hypothetical protein
MQPYLCNVRYVVERPMARYLISLSSGLVPNRYYPGEGFEGDKNTAFDKNSTTSYGEL